MSVSVNLYLWIITTSWITSNVISRTLFDDLVATADGPGPKAPPLLSDFTNGFNKILQHLSLQSQYLPCPAGCLCVIGFQLNSVCTGQQHFTVPQGFSENTAVLTLGVTNITKLLPTSFAELPNLLMLILESNYELKHLGPQSFKGLHSLQKLVIHYNTIHSIDVDAFQGLSQLKFLNLSQNFWITNPPDNVFAGLSILESLDLSINNITKLPDQFHIGFNVLKYLDLSDNYISTVPEQVFAALSHLEFLNLRKNDISALPKIIFERLPKLIYLILSENHVTHLPDSIFVENHCLKFLVLSHNRLTSLSDYIFSPLISLSYLFISHNELHALNPKAFINLTQLNYLNVSNNMLEYCAKGCNHSVFNLTLPKLKTFVISYNRIQYVVSDLFSPKLSEVLEELFMDGTVIHIINHGVLEALTHLKKLSLVQCEIKTLWPTIWAFQNLSNLEILDLSRVRLTKEWFQQDPTTLISETMFKNATKIRELKLNELGISRLEISVLNPLVHLKSLHLSGNKIESVNFTLLPSKLWTQLEEIDLSYNPFICDCQIMWFHHWLSTTNMTVLQFKDPFAYKCAYPKEKRGENILNITGMNYCYAAAPDTFLLIVWLGLFFFSLVSLISSIMHRFRWHVRYWQLLLQSRTRQQRERSEQREVTYDAFVMYSNEDQDWVDQHLCPQLEESGTEQQDKTVERFRLCLHERDWLVGSKITENIVQSIESSRKYLLLVSNKFVESVWCNYEMTLAQCRAIKEDTSNTILVLLEEISPSIITPRLRLQMQRQTYIEWTMDEVGQRLFWTRLRQALKKPQQSLAHELQRSEVVELQSWP